MNESSLSRSADIIEKFTVSVGRLSSAAYPLLVIVVIVNVIFRYVFSRGMIELEEVQWHLYSLGFLLGYAWTYAENEHVRVDIFYHQFSERTKALIEFFGCLFLLLPFSLSITYFSFDFVANSWRLGEGSDNPSGLPARYIIKGVMTVGLTLLCLQGIATLMRAYLKLKSTATSEKEMTRGS